MIVSFDPLARYVRQLLGPSSRDVDWELHQAIMPVLPIPADVSPPPFRDYGMQAIQLTAGGAGNRSEVTFAVGLAGLNDCGLVWVRPRLDGVNNFEVILDPTISGYTPSFNPGFDSRIANWSAPIPAGDFLILYRNNAAPNATGTQQSLVLAAGATSYAPFELGPYLISRGNTILVRPVNDNVALNCVVRWELRRSQE